MKNEVSKLSVKKNEVLKCRQRKLVKQKQVKYPFLTVMLARFSSL